jgi:hypothetical protein
MKSSYRNWIIIGLLAAVVVAAGCAGLDKFFGYDPETDTDTESPAEGFVDDAAPIVDNATGSDWGSIAAGILAAAGAVYIAVRRVQKKLGANPATKGAPSGKKT